MSIDLAADGRISVGRAAIGSPQEAGDSGLVELLAAYQFLQSQNARMSSGLSARLGLGTADLRVLLFLSRVPGSTPKEVSVQLEQPSGTVTALLDRIDLAGHLERTPHPTDRRSFTLRLTESGEEVVRALRGSYRDAFACVFSEAELDTAARVLRALGSALIPAAEELHRG